MNTETKDKTESVDRLPLTSTSRHFLTVSILIFAIVLILFVWLKYIPLKDDPNTLTSDFVQVYLTGRALADGVPIYEPLPNLAARFDRRLNNDEHPSAYPPAFAMLGFLVSQLTYENAFMLWGAFEILCFVVTVLLLFQHFREGGPGMLIVASLFILWRPFYIDLFEGQIMMLAALLLTCSWLLIKTKRDVAGGLTLAVLLSVKLYGWPVLLFLVIARKWRAVVSVIIGSLVINLLALWCVSYDQFLVYVKRVAPVIAQIYSDHPLNFSVLALFGPVVVVLVLSAGLVAAARAQDFDTGFLTALVISTIVSPVAWLHYFLTFLPAICLLVYRNRKEPLRLLPLAIFAEVVTPDIEIYRMFGVRWWPLVLVLALVVYLQFFAYERKAAPSV